MQLKPTTEEAGHSPVKHAQAHYGVLVACNKCGGLHEMAISVVMTDGPVVKQSVGALYRGKTLPKNLADLTNYSITCSRTGRQSTQKNHDQIFLVPPKK